MLRLGLIVAAAVLVLDQITKAIVLGPMAFSPPACRAYGISCGAINVTSFFDLRMVWNEGVSFGLLTAGSSFERWALVALQLAIAGFFFWWLRTAVRPISAVALGLVIGGAVGNVIDRIRFGAVVDFLDFTGLYFPWVFNVADAGINVGAGLLLLDFLLHGDKKPAPTTASESASGAAPQNGPDQT